MSQKSFKAIVKRSDILAYDQRRHTSYHRDIEMKVESICLDVGAQLYVVQFFDDLSLYGHKGALSYLDNFIQDKTQRHPPTAYAEQFAKLSQIFVELQGKL